MFRSSNKSEYMTNCAIPCTVQISVIVQFGDVFAGVRRPRDRHILDVGVLRRRKVEPKWPYYNMATLVLALLQTLYMWWDQDRSMESVTPKYLKVFTCSSECPLRWRETLWSAADLLLEISIH